MYRGFILPEHRISLRKVLDREPIIKTLFSDNWAQKHLFPAPDQHINDVHPFYQYLIHPKEKALTLRGLHFLAVDRKTSIITHIKNEKDPTNVRALVRNIQTYAVLKTVWKGTKLEPSIKDSLKKPDLQAMCDGDPCYIEVFTVTAKDQDRQESRVIDELHARTNLMGDNPFIVHLSVVRPPQWREMEWLWTCMRNVIHQYRGHKQVSEILIKDRNGQDVLKLELINEEYQKGFWGTVTAGGTRHDDARLKNKILDKVTAPQFPSKESVNGYVIYLDDWVIDPRSAKNAILGQAAIQVTQSVEASKMIRKRNGVLHHSQGRDLLLDWVDFFVLAKHPSDLQVLSYQDILYNADRKKVGQTKVRNLFHAD